jgi:hypothetical protein
MVDDGLRWVYDDLVGLLAEINADSGLAGTAYEMHVTVLLNIEGANALRDRDPTNTGNLSEAEVRYLHSSPLVEVGLHGYEEGIHDPSAIQSPWGVKGADWNLNTDTRDSTSYQIIVDGIKAIRDTILGDPTSVVTYGTNGHRLDAYSMQLASRWGIKNLRAGLLMNTLALNVGWPHPSASGNYDIGIVREKNRQNNDRYFQWWRNYASSSRGTYAPFFPMHRLWMYHQDPHATGTIAAQVDSAGAWLYAVAESKGFGLYTWHNQDDTSPNPTTGPDYGGLSGVEDILRYAAGLCANGLHHREGPKLQLLTVAEGTTKVTNWRLGYAGRSINMVDNFQMRPSDWNSAKPWGYPEALAAGAWTDSGWAYVDSTTAAGNSLFGYHGEGGALYTTAADYPASGTTGGLVLVTPVIPDSRAYVSFYSSVDTIAVADGADTDSCEAGYWTITAKYLLESNDPTDSTAAWVDGAASTSGSLNSDPYSIEYTAEGSGGWSSNAGNNQYTNVRQLAPFHTTDLWRVARVTGASSSNFFYDDGRTPTTAPEEQMRWRQFDCFFQIPSGTRAARWTLQPVGFGTEADTVLVAGFEVNCSVQ